MMLSMTFFDFLCNLTVLIIILFTALSYATGLFYLAELAEEYPTITKRIVRYLVLSIVTLHLLAFISALPKLPLALGLLLHLSYLALLTTFPILPLTSPIFYLALLLLVATQLAWYTQMPTSFYTSYPSYSYNNVRHLQQRSTTRLLPAVRVARPLSAVRGGQRDRAEPAHGRREGERAGGGGGGGGWREVEFCWDWAVV